MLHAILVDDVIERIDGGPEFAEAEVVRLRAGGHRAGYLFAARTDDEFRRKSRTEEQRRASHASRLMSGAKELL